jgi:hypothetical protein
MYDENEQLNDNGKEESYISGMKNNIEQKQNKMNLIDTNDLIGIGSKTSNKIINTNFTSSNYSSLDEEQYQKMWMDTQYR